MAHPLEATLGHTFRDPSLLTLALTHPSVGKQKSGAIVNNQRLEFLGDAVLGLLIAEMLYAMYPNEAEGDLSRRLVGLVNGEQCARVAEALGIGEHLILSASEAESGGRALASNIEDACEAIIGALYLDGGLAAVKPVIEAYWKPLATRSAAPPKDPKTGLQEWAQARGLPLPEYRMLSETGPAHAPQFVIEVSVRGHAPVQAEAKSKKIAERLAAEAMLKEIGIA
jgi:ribonuclease-3